MRKGNLRSRTRNWMKEILPTKHKTINICRTDIYRRYEIRWMSMFPRFIAGRVSRTRIAIHVSPCKRDLATQARIDRPKTISSDAGTRAKIEIAVRGDHAEDHGTWTGFANTEEAWRVRWSRVYAGNDETRAKEGERERWKEKGKQDPAYRSFASEFEVGGQTCNRFVTTEQNTFARLSFRLRFRAFSSRPIRSKGTRPIILWERNWPSARTPKFSTQEQRKFGI